jgi:EAL and modified HD-GYP domain-containing signal transduction protein
MGGDGCAERAFTIGLFSVLDALLDVSMDEVLEFLPLDDAVADALRGRGRSVEGTS